MDEVDHHVSRWKDPVMRRRISLCCVLLILFSSGCSAPQKASVAQIDCDGERMASVIARKGQANEYETVVPPGSSRLGEYLETTGKVAGFCALLPVLIVAGFANTCQGGPVDSTTSGSDRPTSMAIIH